MSDRALLGVAALVFVASAVVTVIWCGSMSAMPGMDMPGNWNMSMAWMRMPGQTWIGAGTVFLGMWTMMMLAMMMPVLLPELMRFRRGVGGNASTVMSFAAGYFGVWAAAGVVTFPVGVAAAELAMQSSSVSRAAPLLGGMVVWVAGALQFSGWKARSLACCRHQGGWPPVADYRNGLRSGARLGAQCVQCCATLTVVLLVMGVMDLRAMALVAMAICAERLMPSGLLVARVIGGTILVYGTWLTWGAFV